VVVPIGINDWALPSGGNHYDRRVIDALPGLGWEVREHLVPGSWPTPTQFDRDWFDRILAGLPDGAVVLVDGLIAAAAPSLVDATRRLCVAVLLHMPFAEAAPPDRAAEVARVEAAVLRACDAVIATSNWTRDWIVTHHAVPADRVSTAVPGVDPAPLAFSLGSSSGSELLCVGPVVPGKGQDVLVEALGRLRELPWTCRFVGACDQDPGFVTSLMATAQRTGIEDRVTFAGTLTRHLLSSVRSDSDLVISTSRHEAYGMALAEALSAGLPVIATQVGGQSEAVGRASDGTIPGLLVADGDVAALADALRHWLTDPELRQRWREAAALRRHDLTGWTETAGCVAAALHAVSD
jgi:glycosyltransferase involved in cell wall biosynthesis